MAINVAINGYGRIGRCILRAIYEYDRDKEFNIVAINNISNIESVAHLTKYDTVHGRFNHDIVTTNSHFKIKDHEILAIKERDPSRLPWKDLDIDLVFECTGKFTSKEKCQPHLDSGAKKVLISAPGGSDVDATVVYGVNHDVIKPEHTVVSNASCTTNCLAPLVKPLNDKLGIVNGLMNTVHAYTNDQVLSDVYHKDLRRARAAGHSIIPTKTGAASAVGLVLPELKGKLDGFALRVPVINVSVVDLTFRASRTTSVEEVNSILKEAAASEPLKNILTINELPLVSIDFIHEPASSIFDATQTKVIDDMVKVLSWYDNEWGFANRMLDTAQVMFAGEK